MKNNTRTFYVIWFLLFMLVCHITGAQVLSTPKQALAGYLKVESDDQILIFKESSALSRQEAISLLTSGNTKSLASSMSLVLKKEETDALGISHSTYLLKVNNVEVENGEARFHEKSGRLSSASLPVLNVPSLNTNPAVTALSASGIAVQELTTFTVSAADQAKLAAPVLKIIKNGEAYALAWKTEVYGKDVLDRHYVYVDAQTGKILKKVSRVIHCYGTSSLPTHYNGSRNINYDSIAPGFDGLIDKCRPTSCGGSYTTPIETYYYSGGSVYHYANPMGNPWPTTSFYKTGYSIHWATGSTYDYYRCIHGRDSYNNAAAPLIGIADVFLDNAGWNGMYMLYGNPSGPSSPFSGPIVSLDVVGHELTHAVTEYSGGMIYESEPGALNEAWSDILGTSIEHYVLGGSANYLMGEDVTYGLGLRSMSNPGSGSLAGPPQPDTYGGTYWYNVTGCTPSSGNDYCGVHNNSGVANFWYYLLVNGGSGTNDLSNAYSVTGIGMSDAEDIAYRALTNYFTSTTTFAQARTFTILAAEDLFGVCSNQAIQVAKAWYAVGVGNDILLVRSVCGTFSSGTNTYRAITTIQSGSPYCSGVPVNINSGATVSFLSGKEILLSPNFVATNGSVFLGEITACAPGAGVSQFKKAGQGYQEKDLASSNTVISEAEKLLVYPNPSSGSFQLKSPLTGEFSILNSQGNILFTSAVTKDQQIVLDLSKESKGMYILKISNGAEVKFSKLTLE